MKEKMSFLQLLRKKDDDAVIYLIGIITAAAICVGYLITGLASRNWSGGLMGRCVFRSVTGLYCPGCGGTRAFLYLLHGNIIKSLIYYPFVPYACVILVIFYVSQTLRYISGGRIRGMHMKTCYVVIGAAIIVVNWIVKNILLLCFNIALIN